MYKTCFAAELLANKKPVYSTQHIILLQEHGAFDLYPVLLLLLRLLSVLFLFASISFNFNVQSNIDHIIHGETSYIMLFKLIPQ